MTEKSGKHDLSAGTSWSLFAENTLFEDSEDLVIASNGTDAETTRLHREDMNLLGLCPARDTLDLLICKECQRVLYPVSLKRHYERQHAKLLPNVKSPPRLTLPTPRHVLPATKESKSPIKYQSSYSKSKLLKSPDNSFIRIEEVDPTDITVKIEEVPLTIPKFNHTAKAKLPKINLKGLTGSGAKSKTSPVNSKPSSSLLAPTKKGPGIKDKEYDPDRHCGVWMAEQTRNCTRSLTCKTHSLSLRRAVPGRCKAFDILLAEHKAKANSIKEAGISSGTSTPTPSPTKSVSGNLPFPVMKLDSIGNSVTTQPSQGLRSPKVSAGLMVPSLDSKFALGSSGRQGDSINSMDYLSDENIGSSNLPTIPCHPRPLKVNNFGSCMMKGGGCMVFSKRMSHFRCATSAMVEKLNNPALRGTKGENGSDPLFASRLPSSHRTEGMCTIQVLDQGTARQNVGSFKSTTVNVSSFSDPSQLGPVPRVKTKKAHSGMKRQMSADIQVSDTQTFQLPNKRRHSVDSNSGGGTTPSPNTPIESSSQNGLKPLRELGHVVANIDSVSSYEIKTMGTSFGRNSPQSKSVLTMNSVGNSVNLNSSLNLCQTMGISPVGTVGQTQNIHGLTQTFNIQGPSATAAAIRGQAALNAVAHTSSSSAVNLLANSSTSLTISQSSHSPVASSSISFSVAPNVLVTQGMMVSLPSITQTQTTVLYQGGLSMASKDGISITGAGRPQVTPSSGILLRNQSVSPLPNGTGPSPPPTNKTSGATYGGNLTATCSTYVVGNAKLKASSVATPASVAFANRQMMSANSPRVSQLLVQQPNPSRIQLPQKDKLIPRTPSLAKPTTNPTLKFSQPPSLSPSAVLSNTSNTNLSTNSQYENTSSGLNSNQPMTQIKQVQLQHLQHSTAQRTRQQYLPLNSSAKVDTQSNHGQGNAGFSQDSMHQEILNAGNSSQTGLSTRPFQRQGSFLEPLAPTPSDGDTASIL